MRTSLLLVVAALLVSAPSASAQAEEAIPEASLSFMEYDPPSTLVVPEHEVRQAKFPFVDVHYHDGNMAETDLRARAAEMDELNLAVAVNLSGRGFRRIEMPDGSARWGIREPEAMALAVRRVAEETPGRFMVFTNVDFSEVGAPGWAEEAVAQLEADVAAGAVGLKIYKSLGQGTDVDGHRVPVDDPRLDPIWHACGELGIPVLIHTADPRPFWQKRDADNERLYELIEKAGRYQGPEADPTWDTLIAEQHAIFRRHPETTFINAHLGWLGNDLARLGALLDELPNVYTEIGAVLAELGRQPYFAREWLIRYQDRVLFGKDSWEPDEYRVYFRVLETKDDYIEYYRRRHAFWRLYGLDLPDEVLRKIYYQNALRIVPGIDPGLFPAG